MTEERETKEGKEDSRLLARLFALRKAMGRDITIKLLVSPNRVVLLGADTESAEEPDNPIDDIYDARGIIPKIDPKERDSYFG